MKYNLNNTSIIFIIFITALLNFVEAQDQGYTNKTYDITNTENDQLYYNSVYMLSNGNILIRFFTKLNENCHKPDLYLKLFYENGTSASLKIDNFSLSRFNFCTNTYYESMSLDYYSDNIQLQFVGDDIYIYYYNISESDPNAPFGRLILQANLIEREVIRYLSHLNLTFKFCSTFS